MSEFLEHPQTRGEEIANSVSHGLAALVAAVGAPFLIAQAVRNGTIWEVIGVSVFIGCAVVLYLGSTLFHALPHSGARRVFRILDHGGVFLLIAGTYTPFMLGTLRSEWSLIVLGVVWLLAAAGIVLKALGLIHRRLWSNLLYLGMSWMIVAFAKPLWDHATPVLFLWLIGGGLAYSFGILFYNARLRFSHLVWHVLVITGTALHFVAIYRFVV